MIKQVKVGGITYGISLVPVIEINGSRNYSGLFKANDAQLEIIEAMSDDRKNEILIHELTHAIAYEAHVDMDEDSVIQFSKVLNQVLQDNDFGWLKRDKPMLELFAEGHSIGKTILKV